MSSGPVTPPFPYFAPWPTQFNRYAVQQYPGKQGDAQGSKFSWTVPVKQWWNVVSVWATCGSDSTVASRTVFLLIKAQDGTFLWEIAAPGTLTASSIVFLAALPDGVSTYAAAGARYFAATVGYPNMMLSEGMSVTVYIDNPQPQDAITASRLMAEIYTEDYQSGQLVPLVAPELS